MKVAISIPNDLFAKADAFADRAKMPRSQVYALALDQFLSRESEQEAIARINAVIDELGQDDMAFNLEAARQVLEKVEW